VTEEETMNGNDTPEAAVEAALTGLAADLAGMKAEIKTQLKQQDERLNMLNAKTISLGRPVLAGAAAAAAPRQKAFAATLSIRRPPTGSPRCCAAMPRCGGWRGW
jgi:hypothetical protein